MHPETNRKLRGHRFYPTAAEVKKTPKVYEQDGKGDEAIVYFHYFSAIGDWWITELDAEFDEVPHGYGYHHRSSNPSGSMGYVDLSELERLRARSSNGFPVWVERDCHWTPKPLGECIKKRG